MANPGGIRAGKAFIELGVSDLATKGLRAAQRQLKAFGAGVRNIGLGLSAASASVTAPMLAAVHVFADFGDSVAKASARTGMTAEAMSELGFAAEQSGSDMEGLEKSIRLMQRTQVKATEGSKAATEALAAVGVSAEQLKGMSPDEQLAAIADGMQKITDPAMRTATAMRIFGKSGASIIPMLAQGSAGLAAMRAEAREFGISLSGKDAHAAEVLHDTFKLLTAAIRGVWIQIGAALAPTITDLTRRIATIVAATSKWISEHRPLVASIFTVAKIVGIVGAALVGLGIAISVTGIAVGGLASAFGAVLGAFSLVKSALLFLLTPLPLLITLLGGGAAAFLLFTDTGANVLAWLGDRFGELKDRVTSVLGAIGDAMQAKDLSLAARIAWLAIKAEWIRGTEWLRSIWIDVKTWFVDSWLEVVGGVQIFAAEAWSTFQVAAAEAFAFVSRAWNNVASFMRRIWETVTGWIGDRMIEIAGLFDESLDTAAAKAARSKTDDASIAEINRRQEEEAKSIEGRLQGRRNAAGTELAARRDQIGAGLIEDQRATAAARDAALAETGSALADAQEELRKAMEEARLAREATTETALGTSRPATVLDGLDSAKAKSESRGLFNAAGLQSLQGGFGQPLDRIAKATEKTANAVESLLDKASIDGLVFQE